MTLGCRIATRWLSYSRWLSSKYCSHNDEISEICQCSYAGTNAQAGTTSGLFGNFLSAPEVSVNLTGRDS